MRALMNTNEDAIRTLNSDKLGISLLINYFSEYTRFHNPETNTTTSTNVD